MTTQQGKDITIIKQGNTVLIAKPVQQEKSFIDTFSTFFSSKRVDDNQNKEVSTNECTWTDLAASSNKQQLKKNWNCKKQQWKDIDIRLANSITSFKQQYIMTLGDIRIRSVLMAFSAALLYKTISFNTTGLMRKSRNLGISFAFMGYWFVPQLFNPFLQKSKLVKSVV